jgi:DNA-binding MarR family transcriptional regulator
MKETASSVRSKHPEPPEPDPPEPDPFVEDEFRVWRGFLRTHRIVTDELSRRLERAHDLTLLHYGVLITLVTDPDRQLRMTELAERVLTSPSGMTRAVNRLAGGGLVERDQDPDDRRSFIVRLTPLGVTRLRDAQVTHHACVRELLLDGLDADALRRLAAVYDRAVSGRFE